MPIYEYRCADCGKRQAIFYRSFAAVEDSPACPECGGRKLTRLISRTAQLLSEDTRLESLADSADMGGVDENDPSSVARWARKMGQQMGEDELGDDFDQAMDEMEQGKMPGPGSEDGHGHDDD